MVKILRTYSPDTIAKALGVSVQYITNIKSGRAGFPAGRVKRLRNHGVKLEEFERAAIDDFRETWRATAKIR